MYNTINTIKWWPRFVTYMCRLLIFVYEEREQQLAIVAQGALHDWLLEAASCRVWAAILDPMKGRLHSSTSRLGLGSTQQDMKVPHTKKNTKALFSLAERPLFFHFFSSTLPATPATPK